MIEQSDVQVKSVELVEGETRLASVTLGLSAKVNLGDYSSFDAFVSARWDIGTNDNRTVDAIAHDNRDAMRGALLEQLGQTMNKQVAVIERIIKLLPAEETAAAAKELNILKVALRLANAQEL